MSAFQTTSLPQIPRKRKILIVEDEALVAADLEERLKKLGYEVCGHADTCQGAIAQTISLQPDLVLMDIHLIGEKDGVEAAGEIRRKIGTPVVFLTAHADDATLARITLVQPFGYALKPFDERELKATIEVALYRYQAESRLNKMERWLATTLDSIGDGVIATDLYGKVKFVNSMCEALTGWLCHLALGRNVADIFVLEKEGVNIALTDLLDQAMQQGSAIYIQDGHFLKTRDGRVFPVDDSISVIRDEDENVGGWVIVFRDVSARFEAERKRIMLEGKMRDAQRLESLGVLAGGIAHDFNNLLQVITINTSLGHALLRNNVGDGFAEKMPALLDQIGSATERAGKLCSQMLAYAGKGRFAIQTIDLTTFTRDTVNFLRTSVQKNVNLVLDLTEDIPSIKGDSTQLQQIIMNLVINASEALEGKRERFQSRLSSFKPSPNF